MNQEYRPDRRRKVRIDGPISARVRGKYRDGTVFDLETWLENLSAGGLYLRLEGRVEKEAELSFVIRLPPRAGPDDPGMRVAARGVVRRVEPGIGETCGLGVEFTSYRQIQT